jgi:hypothetical protein
MGFTINRVGGVRAWRRGLLVALAVSLLAACGGASGESAGVIQQVGTPEELYQRPRNLFVAGFIGSPASNFLPGTLEGGHLRTALGDVALPAGVAARSWRPAPVPP